ncbi:MAG: autotransporter outer membrane beta-barrel domain-containing protein [Proteobacteria bacterium]|nr:autotransporter outer membrane beta-barrel domain-containing protein [Pseudomonadota bacterium]MCL2308361.1 autotransporter outer membrane beta-barrel domain-containing protein [Pseudomonadota bacterium]
MSKLNQAFSLVNQMVGSALATLMPSSSAMATHHTSTVKGENPPKILQGGDSVAVTGTLNPALQAEEPGTGIEVVPGALGSGITATSEHHTAQIANRAFLDLGTGSFLKASRSASTAGLVVGGGSGTPRDTAIGKNLSIRVASKNTAIGIDSSMSGLIDLTGNTRIRIHAGTEGQGLSARSNGVLTIEDAEIEMKGLPSSDVNAIQRAIYARDYATITAIGDVSVSVSGSHAYGAYVGSKNAAIMLNQLTATLTGTGSVFGALIYRGAVSLFGSSDVTLFAEANAYGLYTNNQCTVSIGAQGSVTHGIWNITGVNHAAVIRTELDSASDIGRHDIKIHNTQLNSSHDGLYVRGSEAHVVFDNSTLLIDPAAGDLASVEEKSVDVDGNPTPFGSDLLIDARNASQLSGTVEVDGVSRLKISLSGGAQWTVVDDTTITDLMQDNGRLVFQTPKTDHNFKTLTVFENYGATNGAVVMNTRLDDGANPATDMLFINGNTAGTVALEIRNLNGVGAFTVGNGIRVVQVNGHSDAQFTLAQPVAVGTFNYELVKIGNHWYLQSSKGNQASPQRSHENAEAVDSAETITFHLGLDHGEYHSSVPFFVKTLLKEQS